ncbi:ribosome biogenesis GTPase Der [candidate division FCPU426 bacterium]|nr:ribosome biogenesis GTPase Der [candidate division FCPU426 bacterium]
MSRSVVAIVGRPNVGKSALFNRIVGKHRAIVDEYAGLTRDRNYDLARWLDREFVLVDTGGFEPQTPDHIMQQMRRQIAIALEESDIVIMVVDGRTPMDPADRQLAGQLLRETKPVLLAVNKIDNESLESEIHAFWSLGLGEPRPVSALHGRCVDELLDALIVHIPRRQEVEEEAEEGSLIKMAVVGRPNAGKSSLVNRILGQERVLVHEAPGTTRDTVSSFFEYQGRSYQILDTAGVRAKKRVSHGIERYAVMRALRTIEETHVAVLLLDASGSLTEQDEHIAGYIHQSGCACILAVNKWDVIEKDTHTAEQYVKTLRKKMAFVEYAPIITLSAKTGQRVNRLLDEAALVDKEHSLRVKTSLLNKTLQDIIHKHPPPTRRGRVLKIKYISQIGVRPPSFALFVNDARYMHFAYLRHIKNEMRKRFGFEGSPLVIVLRGGKGRKHDG